MAPNTKGQIVIPKGIRNTLGILPGKPLNITIGGGGIHMYPVDEVFTKTELETARTELWKKTAGAWSDEDWEEWNKMRERRRKIELKASLRRKKAW